MEISRRLDHPRDQFVRNTMILDVPKPYRGIRAPEVTTQLIVGCAIGRGESANIDNRHCFKMVLHFNVLVRNPDA
jgi:hypothetical protein